MPAQKNLFDPFPETLEPAHPAIPRSFRFMEGFGVHTFRFVNAKDESNFANFQQDGHMAMRNPVGRVNYQPNSFGEGPRESPERGYRHFPAEEQGAKARLRPESFADHDSQARQFYISQTPP